MAFSFENPTTREQWEYVARCDYFFQVLMPLANPKSRTHWVKFFMELDHTDIPPHILHAATLHGHYILKGGPRQQSLTDLVLRQLLSPSDRITWTSTLELLETEHLATAYAPEAGWRPHNYAEFRSRLLNAPASKRPANFRFRRSLSKRLQEQEEEVFAALAKLEVKITEQNTALSTVKTLDNVCVHIKKVTGVAIRPFSLQDGSTQECGICRGVLSHVEDLDRNILSASERLACGKKSSTLSVKSQGEKTFKRELKERVDRDVQGMNMPGTDIALLVNELLAFKRNVFCATGEIAEMEGKKCLEPVELVCGHVFGVGCISPWLQQIQTPTCPYCRHELAEPKPEPQVWQQNFVEEEEHEAEEEPMDKELAAALGYFAQFDVEGNVLGLDEEGGYETDVSDVSGV